MSRKQTASFAVVPLVVMLFALWVSSMRGPYHYGLNSDPEYPYLMNGINILILTSPGHVDHPGTTLQLLLAGIFAIRHFFTCAGSACVTFQVDIVSHPEAYLRFANFIILSGMSVLIFFLGTYVRRLTDSPALGFLAQGAIFMFPIVLQSLGRVTPEPLLMIISMWYLAPFMVHCIRRAQGKAVSESELNRNAILTGVLFGAGVITKITFAPLGIMLFALQGLKTKLRFVLAAALTAFALLLPVIQKLPAILKWAQSLLVHSGQYGDGPVGLPALKAMQASGLALLKQEPLYGVLFVLTIVAGIGYKAFRKELLFAAIGALVVFLATVKHPGARYLMPGMGLLSFAAVLIFESIRRSRIGLGFIATICILNLIFVTGAMNQWAIGQVWYVSGVAKLSAAAAAAGPNCTVYHYYRASDLTSSLIFGNEYSSQVHADVLNSVYPNALRYNTFAGRFDGFDGKDQTDRVIAQLDEGQCVLIQGMSLIEQNWPAKTGLVKTVLAAAGGETLSRLTLDKSVRPAYADAPPPEAIVVEAESVTSGNVVTDKTLYGPGFGVLTSPVVPASAELNVTLPIPGQYEIRARYASDTPRPLRLLVGGKLILTDFCGAPTGGYFAQNQRWFSAGVFPLPGGMTTIRLESGGPFPHIDKIAFVRAAAPQAKLSAK